MDRITRAPVERRRSAAPADEEMALAALVSRVLDRGVVVTGEVVIGVAGVDLLYLGLDLVLSSVETLQRAAARPPAGPFGETAG